MKGFILTLDSVISLLLLVAVIPTLIFFRTEASSPFYSAQQLHSLSEDALSLVSDNTVGDIVSSGLIDQYVSSGVLSESDLEKNAIDVIGELWIENRTEVVGIIKDMFENMLPPNVGYQVLIDG